MQADQDVKTLSPIAVPHDSSLVNGVFSGRKRRGADSLSLAVTGGLLGMLLTLSFKLDGVLGFIAGFFLVYGLLMLVRLLVAVQTRTGSEQNEGIMMRGHFNQVRAAKTHARLKH